MEKFIKALETGDLRAALLALAEGPPSLSARLALRQWAERERASDAVHTASEELKEAELAASLAAEIGGEASKAAERRLFEAELVWHSLFPESG